jgi:hypothetical protein
MAQTKDLRAVEATEKQPYRFPNWLLFAISALAIFFSPFGFFGVAVVGFYLVVNDSLLSWTVEAILFVVGFIPFAILASRRAYFLASLLVIFGIIDLGIYSLIYMLASLLADPTLGG